MYIYIYIFIYVIKFLSILLRIKIFQIKVTKKIETLLFFNNFFPKNHVFYVTMSKNMAQPDRPLMTV